MSLPKRQCATLGTNRSGPAAARAACHIVSRSATVAPTWDGVRPSTSASPATSGLAAFLRAPERLGHLRPTADAGAGRHEHAAEPDPGRRSVIVATAATLVRH
jgi:hypothetical protein